mgnify:CR=1 FL=1
MQQLFEASVQNERFSLNNVYNDIFTDIFLLEKPIKIAHNQLIELVDKADARKIIKGLLRYSFFIEPVKKPKIETTKYEVRWTKELNGDPRFASYKSSKIIFKYCLTKLIVDLKTPENLSLIKLMVNNTNASYEIPLDYNDSAITPIHQVDNISWCWGELPTGLVQLRVYLMDSSQHNYSDFFKGVYKKIKTKTYLTDRVLTGKHKTNREKRWECHPDSVHFSLRKVAWAIEIKLIQQVCNFDGFPVKLQKKLITEGIIESKDGIERCPITYELLLFEAFKNEIENTTHGKSDFQVGHMNPLKADEEGFTGHSSDNISWISEQGNRIQGSNSVQFIRQFIIKIYKNYRNAGIPNAD